MKIVTAYFGSDNPLELIKDIEVDKRSYYQPLGPAFYLKPNKQEASYSGRYIYEVQLNAENTYTGKLSFDNETNGTFGQYMNLIAKFPEEFMPEEILNDELLTDDEFKYAVDNYLDENEEKYLAEYHLEQATIKEDYGKDYDVFFDGTEYAIYHPQKVILGLKLIEIRSY